MIKCMYSNILIYLLLFSSLFASLERIVTVGGSVTEIIFSLGKGAEVVAVDQSSTIPPEVKLLPQVGYVRALSSEGILSLNPTMIIASSDIGPPNVIKQIRNSKLKMHIFDSPKSFEGVLSLIRDIALVFNIVNKGELLINELKNEHNKILTIIKNYNSPNVVFFMNATNSGSFNAAGNETRADYLINFIGGHNIYKDSFSRYKKISSESLIKMNPDIILIGSMSDNDLLRTEIYQDNNLRYIKAVNNNQVHVIDLGYYLTFGSNFTDAALKLINKVYLLGNEK